MGQYSTVAGYRSQLLTHSIELGKSVQSHSPIVIGKYCFVGTGVTVLGGARLPDYCVLGAASLLGKRLDARYRLYAGVPATMRNELDPSLRYFARENAKVDTGEV